MKFKIVRTTVIRAESQMDAARKLFRHDLDIAYREVQKIRESGDADVVETVEMEEVRE